jgi:parallel beta-helix repeat protein
MNRITVVQFAFLLSLIALVVALSSNLSAADPIPYKEPTYIHVKSNYVLSQNLVNCTMVVECDNVVVDGAGHTLQGAGGPNYIETGIVLAGRKNVTIRNMAIDNYVTGIQLSSCENITIFGNTVSNCAVNIEVGSCKNNRIENNNITGSAYRGILIGGSNNNTIIENNITDNWMGIMFDNSPSSYNAIIGNYIAENEFGIAAGHGSKNRIEENNITKNQRGLGMQDSYDEIIGNCFLDNRYGFQLYASNCTFYHNNFVNSTKHFEREDWIVISPFNSWDNGYEGNYWSDYNGTDKNGDGIGDIPYPIDSNNTDNFPLMKPFDSQSSPIPSPTTVSSPSPTPSPSHISSPSQEPTPSPEPQTMFLEVAILAAIGAIFVISCSAVLAIKRRRSNPKKRQFVVKRVSVGFRLYSQPLRAPSRRLTSSPLKLSA